MEVITCNCKASHCQGKCGCSSEKLTCTPACACEGGELCQNPHKSEVNRMNSDSESSDEE